LYSENRRPDAAAAQYRKTLDLIGRQRSLLPKLESKLSYLSSLIRFYREYVDFLMTSGKKEEALEAVESSRAQLLAERTGSPAAVQSGAALYRRIASRSRAVLLSYWLGEKRSFLWAVSETGITVRQLPPEPEICRLVDSHNSRIQESQDP